MRLRVTPSLGPIPGWIVCLALAGVLATLAGGAAGCSGNSADNAEAQLRFGVRMAQRGLWSEALFRFEKAKKLDPNNARILNNLAVAQEAAGRYEDALATYKQALDLAPGDRDLKQNYAHFVDFYESFRPPKPGAAPEGTAPETPGEPKKGSTGEGAP
jgi:tetratricopeptide (TPR) repeat protein